MEFNLKYIYDLLTDKLIGWWEGTILMLPNLTVAVIVLTAFFVLARFAQKVTNNIIGRFSERQALKQFVPKIVLFVMVGMGIFLALSILKLDKTITSLLAGAGIAGLALSLAFKESATDIMGGLFLIFRKPLKIGDIIETNGVMGTVEKIKLSKTIIQSFQGQQVYIPNKMVIQDVLTNYSSLHKRRVDIELGVSYADNLKKVKNVLLELINDLPFIRKQEEVSVFFEEFASSSIQLKLMFWIDYPDEPSFLQARSKAIMTIKKAFDQHDITIPYPIRTLDFGIKGGKNLSEMTLKNKTINHANNPLKN